MIALSPKRLVRAVCALPVALALLLIASAPIAGLTATPAHAQAASCDAAARSAARQSGGRVLFVRAKPRRCVIMLLLPPRKAGEPGRRKRVVISR